LASRWVTIGVTAILIVTCLSCVGLYLLARDPFSESEIRHLIDVSYSRQRPAGGRLSGASYVGFQNSAGSSPDIGKAQILLLRQPDSETRRRLQGLIHIAAGDWEKFVEIAAPSSQTSVDPAVLNNLGVGYLGLSAENPAFLLKALDAFDRAANLNPKAPEPVFNLVVTYRKLRFPKLADESLSQYAALDSGSDWRKELENDTPIDEASVADQLRAATENNNLFEAERLFNANPELCRRLVMQFALSNEDESPALLNFIATQTERRYGDKTLAAMLAPLFTNQRDTAIAVRDLVNQGADLYQSGALRESLSAYTEATRLARGLDSLFDRLWIDVNRVDTLIRTAQLSEARQSLTHIVDTSRANGFIWMVGKAESIYGFSKGLTDSYSEMLRLLSEADRTLVALDAPHDRIRALYSLSGYRNGAGDHDEALRLSLECLRLTNDEPRRISRLDLLIGSILYQRGAIAQALMFDRESVEQSRKTPEISSLATTAAVLAELYESTSDHKSAERYLQIAQDASRQVPPGLDRTRTEMPLGVAAAKIQLGQNKYVEAESQLKKNLELYSQQPFPATSFLSSSLMLLARTYSETGRLQSAAEKFDEAIRVVEKDDKYLESEKSRVGFDDERRELYDAAIDFEFRTGSTDEAWTYLQKYRAKLFLEFLAQFNPNIEKTRTRLDRSRVQQMVPKDTQIVEYALLKDRLLIWLLTDKLLTVRSVPIKRADLEGQVERVLKTLRNDNDADLLLTDLGRSLIEPVANLLDPNRTIVIIPDRALHGLPFGALRRPGKNEYLIQEFPIVVSPSLTYFLAGNGRIAGTARDAIVGFGSQNGGASELKELHALSGIYKTVSLYAGREVDKAKFLGAMSRSSIFHYAGHSATDAVDPLRSSILLDGNRSGPNSVTAVDISQQRLPSNAVVILSSCDSSIGNSRDGVGVRGLTSAFLIGGAGAVVGSLWPVEATSTAELMIRFHHAFAANHMTVAQALREAQLSFLKSSPEQAHPYYWSGFVVTGNFSALR
jgi:CHAT domain-containing protein